LSAEHWREVLEVLREGALKAGFDTDRWTLKRIREVIRRRYGVSYHPNYLAARLRASGWSPQVPAVRAKERDEELIRAWLEQDWPRIRKKSPAEGGNHRVHR
jgi:transposase